MLGVLNLKKTPLFSILKLHFNLKKDMDVTTKSVFAISVIKK
ncbi:hypothetical protein P700755_000306 [Psychroflexus torquis ATCC 700755]|uniref:Uncharacterized protein n=1 Tax=Psychroflexus torquis (strain ATCC 700755 / CIP 106069 / ACAM 623) TaxID=313595 RepID=K4IA88_PSYTT|nr:hypothetical protein P700755_000306 [Psychroflexus torquis ATCC 700755]